MHRRLVVLAVVLVGSFVLAPTSAHAAAIPTSVLKAPSCSEQKGAGALHVDLNGDGNRDLLVGCPGTRYGALGWVGSVLVYLRNAADTGFETGTHLVPGAPPTIAKTGCGGTFAVGDVDGDANLDVVASCAGDRLVTWFGDGDGAFTPGAALVSWSPTEASSRCGASLVVADVNGDGDDDVVTGCGFDNRGGSSFAKGGVRVLVSNGTGGFEPAVAPANPGGLDSGECGTTVALGDVMGSSALDIVAACPLEKNGSTFAGSFVAFAGNGDGTFATGERLSTSGAGRGYCTQSTFYAADVLADLGTEQGRDEIVYGCRALTKGGVADAGALRVVGRNATGDGWTVREDLAHPVPKAARCGADSLFADVIGDSAEELVMACPDYESKGSVVVFPIAGDRSAVDTGGAVVVTADTTDPSAQCGSIGVADLTGDGKLDLGVGCRWLEPGGVADAGGLHVYERSGAGDLVPTRIEDLTRNPSPTQSANCGWLRTPASPALVVSCAGTETAELHLYGVSGGPAGAAQPVTRRAATTNISSHWTFGMRPIGSSYTSSITVTNTGLDPVTITDVTSSSPSFVVDPASPCLVLAADTLGVGQACAVSVTFTASRSSVALGGVLSFDTNVDGGMESIDLIGGSTVVSIVASPASFGDRAVGSTTTSTVTVTNLDSVPVNVASVSKNGTNAAFSLAANGCNGVQLGADGGTCTFSVAFTPTTITGFQTSSTFYVNHDGVASEDSGAIWGWQPKHISLSGTAVAATGGGGDGGGGNGGNGGNGGGTPGGGTPQPTPPAQCPHLALTVPVLGSASLAGRTCMGTFAVASAPSLGAVDAASMRFTAPTNAVGTTSFAIRSVDGSQEQVVDVTIAKQSVKLAKPTFTCKPAARGKASCTIKVTAPELAGAGAVVVKVERKVRKGRTTAWVAAGTVSAKPGRATSKVLVLTKGSYRATATVVAGPLRTKAASPAALRTV